MAEAANVGRHQRRAFGARHAKDIERFLARPDATASRRRHPRRRRATDWLEGLKELTKKRDYQKHKCRTPTALG